MKSLSWIKVALNEIISQVVFLSYKKLAASVHVVALWFEHTYIRDSHISLHEYIQIRLQFKKIIRSNTYVACQFVTKLKSDKQTDKRRKSEPLVSH